MAESIKGDVVVITFSFTDLPGSKRRPALMLADLPGDDIILCQITSQHTGNKLAVPITYNDLRNGSLPVPSFIRPDFYSR